MENESLASELIHEIKLEAKRRFIIIIILIIILFLTNAGWLIAWNIPIEDVTESYELEGEDDANVIYSSGQGSVNINGENTSN